MSFIADIFAPSGPPPLGSAANPIPTLTPAAIPSVPTPPTAPVPSTQAQAPPSFAPTAVQAASQRAQVSAGTPSFLGAAATAGQTTKAKATLG